ncbi:MAG: ABC transporter ATP-binding protein/permease [Lachnospiraceae bacterium]|nr:ABC transporter ATP-binding protein/permease [Lachnospiraceae bacterium]
MAKEPKAKKKEELDEYTAYMKEQRESGNASAGKPNQGMRPGGGRGRGPGMKEKPKDLKGTLRRLIAYIGRSKWLVIVLLAMTVLTTILTLAGPDLQGKAIGAIFTEAEDGSHYFDGEALTAILIKMGVIYLVSSVISYITGFFAAKLSLTTVYNMRRDLFRRISYLKIKVVDSHRHGDIMSRMTNDVENVSNTISSSISSLFSAAITLVGSLIMMLKYSPLLTLVSLVTIPLTILASTQMTKLVRKYFVRQQKLLGQLNGAVEENVTGYRTVVAYGREERAVEDFGVISDNLKHTGIRANIFGSIMGPLMNVIGNFGFLLITVTGGYLSLKGAIAVSALHSFIQYSRHLNRPINEVANQYSAIMTAIAGAERVFEIMDAPGEENEGGDELDDSTVRGELDFRDIMFSYVPGEPVLKHFDLHVNPGETVAIVGRTGSGKTTVVNLLTRFYDIDGGEILLDGKNIESISKKELREAIGIVLQDSVLFSDTIENNIRYGRPDATDEEVRAAAKTANADLFVERLPDGYAMKLSESGENISQGQRQLLCIARAALADPKILILDEATSSVDTRTEMQIQLAMLELMKNRTSLVIAHRLSTIRNADKIIVLADGHIVESGNHEELLEQKGVYYELYQTQFAGMET